MQKSDEVGEIEDQVFSIPGDASKRTAVQFERIRRIANTVQLCKGVSRGKLRPSSSSAKDWV
jgi:hypothetical protein